MRLGLLADIHEAVPQLRAAVAALNARQVDSFIVLGDILETGERAEETIAILSALAGEAVWGNHDFGLCGDVPTSLRARFSQTVWDYFARLRPTLTLAGMRFQHIDPHLDARDLADLWRFSTTEERLAGLRRCSESRIFMGHLHCWSALTALGGRWHGAVSESLCTTRAERSTFNRRRCRG
jgi:predicted phosphodiesterase